MNPGARRLPEAVTVTMWQGTTLLAACPEHLSCKAGFFISFSGVSRDLHLGQLLFSEVRKNLDACLSFFSPAFQKKTPLRSLFATEKEEK